MPRAALTVPELQAQRQLVCAAALRLHKDEGASAVSFRKLAEVTGASHTQPYRYFDNKAGLFAAMRLECFRRFAALIRANDPAAADPATRLASIYDAILVYVRAEPDEYQLMFAADQPPLTDHPALLGARREAFDYLVGIVDEAIGRGLMAGDARDVMHIAWGAVHGLLNLHTAGQLVHGRDLESLTRPLLARILHPLFDAEPARGGADANEGRP